MKIKRTPKFKRKPEQLGAVRLQERDIATITLVHDYVKVRHLPPSSNLKPAFYLPSYLQIEDILSSFLLNVDKSTRKN